MKSPSYDLRECELKTVRALCELYHGYHSTGGTATYAFAVYENEIPVAAYAWQPPPPGSAKSVCPQAPHGVLTLSRMVAAPKAERALRHISRPLRRQMRTLIDRTRWPVLVTYSDEGQGHTGHVYKCSGWQKTKRSRRPTYLDDAGRRVSSYSDGHHDTSELRRGEPTWIQRWEHWVCSPDDVVKRIESHWRRVPVPGLRWRSGNQAYTYVERLSA